MVLGDGEVFSFSRSIGGRLDRARGGWTLWCVGSWDGCRRLIVGRSIVPCLHHHLRRQREASNSQKASEQPTEWDGGAGFESQDQRSGSPPVCMGREMVELEMEGNGGTYGRVISQPLLRSTCSAEIADDEPESID